ncbi:hypothetical protein L596_026836 [Steinernema carpocapsae]|uniref:Uncharacterized protein n=1 Tax=Steinernema carpocapsae TaxID=34508 RepID=A0A4U5M2I5_STECR|nr:hypothetical protein L596_026836 [Steinernema carpocapsae]
MNSITRIPIRYRDFGASTLNCVPGCVCDTALDRIQCDGTCNNMRKRESEWNVVQAAREHCPTDCIGALCVQLNRVKPDCCVTY